MTRRRTARAAAFMLGVAALGGCTKYHQVTDLSTGAVYYTTSWDLHRYGNSSAVRLRDHTGQIHTLNDADVLEILESEYTTNTGG